MTYVEIEAFLAVVEEGTLSGAAQSLFVTQPTLGNRLQSLESELGAQLILRRKGMRRVELTEAGTRFVPVAEKWKKLWEQTRRAVAPEQSETFNIASVGTVNTYIMPEVYRRFMRRKLPVSPYFCLLHSDDAYRQVENGEMDVALVDNPRYSSRVVTTPLFREKMMLVCSVAGSSVAGSYETGVSPDMLRVEDEVLVKWANPTLLWHDYWFGLTKRPWIYTDSPQMLEHFITRPGAWAVVSASAAMQLERRKQVRRCALTEPPPDRVIYLLSRSPETEPVVQALLQDLRAVLGGYESVEFL